MNSGQIDISEFRVFAKGKKLIIAFSGGVDSTVLLDLCKGEPEYMAVHVNYKSVHQGVCVSDQYEEFVRSYAEANNLNLQVHVTPDPLKSELARREFKYAVLKKYSNAQTVVATAHHLQDQTETLLLKYTRGFAPRGWFIPKMSKFGEGILYRPFLTFTKESINDYAEAKKLQFYYDVTNDNEAYIRNRIRHRVIPELLTAHPNASSNMRLSTQLLNEQSTLVEEYLQLLCSRNQEQERLNVKKLLTETPIRRRWIINFWLQRQGIYINNTLINKVALACANITEFTFTICKNKQLIYDKQYLYLKNFAKI